MKKKSRYIVKLDPDVAGTVGNLCPQESIGCSLSKFIEIQLDALEREYFDLINQDCIVSLPVEIVDTLRFFYPGLSFREQVICAVRSLADLMCQCGDCAADYSEELTDYYQELAGLQKYYASGGDILEG